MARQSTVLQQMLADTSVIVRQLSTALDKERQALAANLSAEELLPITNDKQQVLAQLQKSSEALIQQFGSRDKLEAAIAQLEPAIRHQWLTLQSQLQQLQQQNTVNGQAIHVSLYNTKRLLSLFKGQQTSDDSLYTADGTTVADNLSSRCTEA